MQVREAAKMTAEKAAVKSPRTPPAVSTPAADNSRLPPSSSVDSPAAASTPQTPRLGIVEAAFVALGSVELLQAKMRAMEFRSVGGCV